MPSAAALRLQIETALATRIPGALTPRPRTVRDLAPTGIAELDALLEGGLPVGAISELVGPHSSGRTTLALATLAEMTTSGRTVAWVDASDTLDPESAAAAGVDLLRLLWVRCGVSPQAGAMAAGARPSGGAALLVEGHHTAASSGGCGSPHPRSEVRGLSEAVGTFFQPDVFSRPAPPRNPVVSRSNRMIGTPSAPNRKLLDRTPQDARPLPRRARDREEQIPSDRQPSRRQQWNAQGAEQRSLQAAQIAHTAEAATNRPRPGAWTDNANNAGGRSLATPPNAIAAGLPRFREMEAQAAGHGPSEPQNALSWKPSLANLVLPDGSPQSSPETTPTNGAATIQSVALPLRSSSLTQEPGGPAHDTKAEASLVGEPPPSMGRSASPLWHALDQALRTTDLLLSAGGFSTVVLDLGNIPPEFSWRIPLATWFRFRAAADRARAVFLLLTQHPCARSGAELVLRLSPVTAQDATTVLTGAQFRVAVDRLRFEGSAPLPVVPQEAVGKLHLVSARKQPQRERDATWTQRAAWTGTGPRPAGQRSS